MSCNTFIPIMDLVREVEALLAANYIDKDDPRITGGVLTNPTIKEGFLLDVQAREEFCRLVQECGLDAPFGKMWLSRPLYPDSMFVSYEDSGEPQTKWKTIQAVLESAGVFGPAANSLSSRLAAEVNRAVAAENALGVRIGASNTSIQANTDAIARNADAIAEETRRSSAAEGGLADAVAQLGAKDALLQSQVDSIGGGNRAYVTYAQMVAAAARPEGDPLKLPANSSVDVVNDPDSAKNGMYAYDGSTFTKSAYDVQGLILRKVQNVFSTKVLMDASGLPDGSRALVDADTSENNGLYVKVGGVWGRPAYNPVKQANSYTDGEINKVNASIDAISPMKTTGDLVKVPFELDFIGQYNADGTKANNPDGKTSKLIAVKKGDCFLVTHQAFMSYNRNTFAFFDADKVFVSTSELTLAKPVTKESSTSMQVVSTTLGDIDNKLNLDNRAFIAPADGYLAVTLLESGSVTNIYNPSNKKAGIYKTDLQTLLNNISLNTDARNLLALGSSLQSIALDKNIPSNGTTSINYGSLVVGSPILYSGNYGSISIKYPIAAGQYLHVYTNLPTSNEGILFEDNNGNYLGSQTVVDEYSSTARFSPNGVFNCKSNFTGYVRIVSTSESYSNRFIAITDSPIAITRRIVDPKKPIVFLPIGGTPVENMHNAYPASSVNSYAYGTGNERHLDMSVPYYLEKGTVLEYNLEAANLPLLAYVKKVEVLDNTSVTTSSASSSMPLLATEVLTPEHLAKWEALGLPSDKLFLDKATKGSVYYCNEDDDVVIYFARPNPLNPYFKTMEQSTKYTVKTHTVEEFKALRNKQLSAYFKKYSAMNVSRNDNAVGLKVLESINKGLATYKPILLFKGEVLQYLSSFNSPSIGLNLDYYRGTKVATEISMAIDRAVNFTTAASNPHYQVLENTEVSLTNPLTYFHNQIFATSTCIIYPSVQYKKTSGVGLKDPNGILTGGYFEPRIINLKDAEIGINLIPAIINGMHLDYSKTSFSSIPESVAYLGGGGLSTNLQLGQNTAISFLPANKTVRVTTWQASYGTNLFSAPAIAHKHRVFPDFLVRPQIKHDRNSEWDRVSYHQRGLIDVTYTAKEDSFVMLNTQTRFRNRDAVILNGDMNELFNIKETVAYVDTVYPDYEFGIKHISETKALEYEVTDKTWFNIPITSDLVFNFCTATSTSLDDAIWSILQIKKGDEVLITLNAKTENQGQSSAASRRKNVNVEFFNRDYEDVFIKFGDNIEEAEIVVKSFLNSDRGHWKEATSTDLWHSMRTADPASLGSPLPKEVFSNVDKPLNQSAKGAPFVFPVEHHKGGKFFSLASIRNKKKRANYAMDKKNKNNILIQVDGTAMSFNWPTVQLGNFEVREPDIPGYTEGDSPLPPEFASVETAITRLTDWMAAYYNDRTGFNIRGTYKDYIDLESFLDYALAVDVAWHWDGVRNNFILGTHDAAKGIWRAYWYDSDQSMGAKGSSAIAPFSNDWSNFFHYLLDTFKVEAAARYAHLRDLGIIDIKAIQNKELALNGMINNYAKLKDMEYWGVWNQYANVAHGVDWIDKRINYLDGKYNYAPRHSNRVAQVTYTLSSLVTGGSKDTTITGVAVEVGDTLRVEHPYPGVTATATSAKTGEVTVTFKNVSGAATESSAGYIHIYKGV